MRLLRFLCRKGGTWSGRQLAAALGLDPVTAHRALRILHQATVVEMRQAGRSFLYTLRGRHVLVRTILRPLFEREAHLRHRLERLAVSRLTNALGRRLVTLALYGSLIGARERPTSDIDVLVVVRSMDAKRTAQRVLQKLWIPVAEEFGNPLAPYVNTVQELRRKARLPILDSIRRRHRVLWGRPLEEVLHGRQT